jgi:hypothetical protein
MTTSTRTSPLNWQPISIQHKIILAAIKAEEAHA